MSNTSDKLILAIETSRKRGSLALLGGEATLAVWTGDEQSSSSADLLPQIKWLLERRDLRLAQIAALAVSVGPGSFTGLRVGIATAQALAFASRRPICGVPLLAALADAARGEGRIVAVAGAGRALFFRQAFRKSARQFGALEILSAPETISGEQLLIKQRAEKTSRLIFEPEAFESYTRAGGDERIAETYTGNLANLIGRYCASDKSKASSSQLILPLYVREAIFSKNF